MAVRPVIFFYFGTQFVVIPFDMFKRQSAKEGRYAFVVIFRIGFKKHTVEFVNTDGYDNLLPSIHNTSAPFLRQSPQNLLRQTFCVHNGSIFFTLVLKNVVNTSKKGADAL